MFKFLKEKLKQAASVFSKKVEEDEGVREEPVERIAKAPDEDSFPQDKAGIEDATLPEDDEKKREEQEAWQAQEESLESARKAAEEKAEEDARIASEQLAAEEKARAEEEEAKLLEETRRKDEDDRQAEKERLRLLDDESRRIEEARLLEEEKLREEEEKRILEEKRREDEQKRAKEEQARIAHQKRIEEEKLREEARLARARQLEEEERANKEELAREEQEEEKRKKEPQKKLGFFQKLFGRKDEEPAEKKPSRLHEASHVILEKEEFEKVEEDYSPAKEDEAVPAEEEKGFFGKIKESLTTIKLTDEKFNELFWDLELGMLENNVAVEVIEKIKEDLRVELTTGKVSRKSVDQIVHDTLKKSIEGLFSVEAPDLIRLVKSKADKPFTIAFIGVNGSGKTTTMAKVAHLLLKNKLSVVFAASDTFRAAAIQQLQEHADRLGVKMIRHDYESDPAAVAFDAVKHAKAKGIDVVLIDTAGRLHTNDNLMNELKKLIRVNQPDLKIFIGEAITGNDCVEQARLFNEAVGIDGIILAKADIDEKGGAALSVSYVTGKPILYMGTGQKYEDLVEFRASLVLENIGL